MQQPNALLQRDDQQPLTAGAKGIRGKYGYEPERERVMCRVSSLLSSAHLCSSPGGKLLRAWRRRGSREQRLEADGCCSSWSKNVNRGNVGRTQNAPQHRFWGCLLWNSHTQKCFDRGSKTCKIIFMSRIVVRVSGSTVPPASRLLASSLQSPAYTVYDALIRWHRYRVSMYGYWYDALNRTKLSIRC